MFREPALEVGGCLLGRHRPEVRRVTHTHKLQICCACTMYSQLRALRKQEICGVPRFLSNTSRLLLGFGRGKSLDDG
eukprot:2587827-Prymnesium_polylepis.1